MAFRKRPSSVLDGDRVDDLTTGTDLDAIDDVLARAEEAEAEAAEAEALASAARARARALRLRREAQAAVTEKSRPPVPETAETPELDVEEGVVESTEPAELTAVTEDEQPAPARRRQLPRLRIRWRMLAVSLATVATIALVTLSVLMVVHHRDAQSRQQRAAEFAAAARQGVVTLMSLNFSTAKDDVQRIIDNAAGQFKEDFEASAADFTTVAERSKVITEANVNATAVQSMTDDSAVVLVAATSRITNETGAQQDPRTWRLIVDVVRDGDRIKLSKVEFAP